MGSKNTPGKFDCYANAEPDEPMFVLLGRDKHAPLLVRLWADLRAMDGERGEKVTEARACADHMVQFRGNRQKRKSTIAELEAILASEDDRPIQINPDGSITAL